MTNPVFAIGDELLAEELNGIATNYEVEVFTASGTWTKPDGCVRVLARVQAGGGSGGGCAATGVGQISLGGGGGGGGYCEKLFLADDLANSETVDVGAGGAAATAGANPGNTGGTSRFATGKAYVLTANGGTGGTGSGAGTGTGSIAGGTGGTASGGDVNIQGGDGHNGTHASTTVLGTAHGGASKMAPGIVKMPLTDTTGTAGRAYGGGSTGAANYNGSQGAKASQIGGVGIVIVYNYF